MTERDAFLERIKAAPDDDAPRLVYADWLDEQGEPERAEFIRLGCELATNDPKCLHTSAPPKSCAILPKSICPQQLWCDRCKRWDYLRNRHQELVLNMLDQFYGLPPAIRSIGGWDWSRGFVESVTLSAADWLKHGDAILAAHPVQVVTLSGDIDWYCPSLNGKLVIFSGPVSHQCRSAVEYGWLGQQHLTVIHYALRSEWPTVRTWKVTANALPATAPFR